MRGHRRKKGTPKTKPQGVEQAKEAALRLLRYRPRSERELLSRLQAKGWDEPTAQQVVAQLKQVGLVDDRQMAELVVQSALRDSQPHSRFEVRHKLRTLKIPDEVAEEVLAVWTEEVEREMAMRYLRRRLASVKNPSPQDFLRAFRAAKQRGFAFDALQDALRSFGAPHNLDETL